ncbi:hypothetical protein ACH4FX_39970 [Streptomyces sp. NPDC018019]
MVGQAELESIPPEAGTVLADLDARTVIVTDGSEIADSIRA